MGPAGKGCRGLCRSEAVGRQTRQSLNYSNPHVEMEVYAIHVILNISTLRGSEFYTNASVAVAKCVLQAFR